MIPCINDTIIIIMIAIGYLDYISDKCYKTENHRNRVFNTLKSTTA